MNVGAIIPVIDGDRNQAVIPRILRHQWSTESRRTWAYLNAIRDHRYPDQTERYPMCWLQTIEKFGLAWCCDDNGRQWVVVDPVQYMQFMLENG